MQVSDKEYQQMTKKASPNSPVLKDCTKAFLIGGFLCTLGEVIFQLVRRTGLDEQNARLTASVSLIFLAVVLTGFQVFDNIAKHAGAGTIVPITGFANSVASPAMEFKTEGLVYGMAAKMFIVAGPIIVFGVLSGTLVGLLYLLL